MRLGWYILALFLGLLAAAVVLVWPQAAVWSTALPQGVYLARDRYAGSAWVRGYQTTNEKHFAIRRPRVLAWEAVTGKLAMDVELPFEEARFRNLIIAPDIRHVIVAEQFGQHGAADFYERHSIFALPSAKRIGEPLSHHHMNGGCFSPDGRCSLRNAIRRGIGRGRGRPFSMNWARQFAIAPCPRLKVLSPDWSGSRQMEERWLPAGRRHGVTSAMSRSMSCPRRARWRGWRCPSMRRGTTPSVT